MKNNNFPILLAVIVLVALAAQFMRPSHDQSQLAMRRDLEKSLQLLWDRENQQVEITASGLRATVSMPAEVSPRQQRWNYPFLRFVARRHPDLNLQTLEVIDASSRRPIPEVAMSGMLAEVQAPRGDSPENVSLLTGRRLTMELEVVAGQGRALVLVDAHSPRAGRDAERYGCRAAPPRESSPAVSMDVCLIVPSTISLEALEKFQAEQVNHGETIRIVRLPAP